MRKALVYTFSALLLSMTVSAYAQQAPPPSQQPPAQEGPSATEDDALTLRGCLTKGSAEEQYVVADQDSGQNIPFAGPAKLDTYVNQVVEIRGRVVERGGKQAFLPESIKQIASSCESPATQK